MLDSKSGMKPGDYLFIQFGINDGSPDCDRHVGVEAFKESYGVMAEAAKERGATPVFVAPLSMIACNGSTARGSRGDFVPATLEAAKNNGVPALDLHADSVALYQSLGFCPIPGGDVSASTTGPVGEFFCDDHTHLSRSGAVRIAKVWPTRSASRACRSPATSARRAARGGIARSGRRAARAHPAPARA